MVLGILPVLMLCSVVKSTHLVEFEPKDKIDPDFSWEQYVQKYSGYYDVLRKDDIQTRKTFEENVAFVKLWNQNYTKGLSSFKVGVTIFSAMTPDQKKMMFSKRKQKGKSKDLPKTLSINYESLPEILDYRAKGIISNVKYQGRNCASCYAFSVTDSIEAQYAMKNKYVELSVQELVDCTDDVNLECEGGYMDSTFEYVKENGVNEDYVYPYRAKYGTCHKDVSTVKHFIKDYEMLPSGDENYLKFALNKYGPLAIGIDATLAGFMFYQSGVFDHPECETENLSHTGLLVGYGTEHGEKYWLVKNSWSEYWGEDGYIKIKRDAGNVCGVATNAMYPII